MPRLGHQLRWEMDSHLKETVDLTQITCNVIMKIGPIKMLDKTYRLPDLLASMGAGLSGALQPPAGPWKQTWHFQVPRTVPVARHCIQLRARTADGKNFLALNLPLDFSHRFRPAPTSDSMHSLPGTDRELSWSL
jgi:hypothetical protein